MITNERQYRITRAEAERFEEALARAEEQGAHLHPRLQRAMREGLESQLQELREQLAEYEALRSGQIAVLELDSLQELPDALIRARTAAGLTQRELAGRLGLKEQQVQRYEATRYAGASLERIQQVAEALGAKIRERITLPAATEDDPANPSGHTSPTGLAGHRARSLAGALVRTGLNLHDLASRLNIPNGFALKLQRGRVDPQTLPDRFAARLGETLGTDAEEARALVSAGTRRGDSLHLRSQGRPTVTAEPDVVSFHEALASCPDLTPEQRREWLSEED